MSVYVVKVQDARARIYDAQTRAYKGSVGSNVVSAQVSNDPVQVTRTDGRVEIYNATTRVYTGGF